MIFTHVCDDIYQVKLNNEYYAVKGDDMFKFAWEYRLKQAVKVIAGR